MSASIETQLEQLRHSMAVLESQRAILGDAVVEAALASLREKIAVLQVQSTAAAKSATEEQLANLQRSTPEPLAQKVLSARHQAEAERKPVTILFADIVGSTSMAEKLDPEEWKEIVIGAHQRVSEAIYRYEGTIAQLLGDGVLAFFGAPITHEDDPVRAVSAALEIQRSIREYSHTLEGYVDNFQMRIGINTGIVVVGNIGSDLHIEYLAIGDSVNLAARLQAAAQPGQVLLSESTARLVRVVFEVKSLGDIQVKGKTEPIPIFEVVNVKAILGRGRKIEGLTSPLVGRQQELTTLLKALSSRLVESGQIIAVLGEAGIGKSRLVEEVQARTQAPLRWLEGRSPSYGQSLSFWAINQLLKADLGLSDVDPEARIRVALRRRVDALLGSRSSELLPFLTHLLGLRLEGALAERVQGLDGEKLKREILFAIREYLSLVSAEHPTVWVLEDLHWADPSTLETLELLLSLTDHVPLRLLLTFRPERDAGAWQIKLKAEADFASHYVEIALAPLSPDDSMRLVNNLLDIRDLPDELHHLLLERSEGNPFYLEEIIRSLIEQGALVPGDHPLNLTGEEGMAESGRVRWRATRKIEKVTIPDTLQAVLLARIDSLTEEVRRTLQVASVIGRTFSYRLLAAVEEGERELDVHIARLQRADLVREKARQPELEYIFKHALSQEAAYNSLLLERRREFHRKVGEALETLFPDRTEEFYGLLAYHFGRAESPEKAIYYNRRAAERAQSTFANVEAIAFYRAALEQVQAMSASETNSAQAAQLDEQLGILLELTGHYDDAIAVYREALVQTPSSAHVWQSRLQRCIGHIWMAQQQSAEALLAYASAEEALGAAPEQAKAEWWQEWAWIQIDRMNVRYWLNQADEALKLTESVKPIVEQYGTPFQKVKFFGQQASLMMRRERYAGPVLVQVIEHLDLALGACREMGNLRELASLHLSTGMAYWLQGNFAPAEENLQSAVTLGERVGDVWAQTVAMTYLTMTYRQRGDSQTVRQYVPRCMDIASQGHWIPYVGMAQANLGWLEWRANNLPQAEEKAHAALDLWRSLPTSYMFQWAALWVVLACAMAKGQLADAIEQARALLATTQVRLPDPIPAALESAFNGWEHDDPEQARLNLAKAVKLAGEMGYL